VFAQPEVNGAQVEQLGRLEVFLEKKWLLPLFIADGLDPGGLPWKS